MTPVEEQFAELKERYSEAVLAPVGDGSFVVTIPNVVTGPGWSAPSATVKFHVPVQYPTARPDCFWTEHGLTLAGGRAPQNTGVNPIPGPANGQLLWFSWHITHWSPNDDTLTTYLNVIRNRFADPR
jgi:hypothetical protein